jgi:periplasmic protein TonB
MSFVQPKTNATGRTVAIGIAILFQVALVYALASGLGHKIVAAISQPLETKLIEEVKPPPPPAKVIELPPPPKFKPPPAYVPPPEVNVPAPPPTQPTITATVAAMPPLVADTPPAPPAPPALPAPAPAPAAVAASVACSNYAQVMSDAGFPREATRLGLDEGRALIQFTLGPNGEVKDVKVVNASHPIFAKGAMRIVSEYKCTGQGRDVTVQVPFAFKSS